MTDKDGIDGPFNRAMDRAIAHDKLQRIPVLHPEAHEVAAYAITFDHKRGEFTGLPLVRWRCPCGARGQIWYGDAGMAMESAERHIARHVDAG